RWPRDWSSDVCSSDLHLTTQRTVYVLDLNTTLDKARGGLKSQSIALVLGNRQIQRTLDGLSLGFRLQSFLGALDFHGIQLKVLVRPIPCRGHESTPSPLTGYHLMYTYSIFVYMLGIPKADTGDSGLEP